MAKYVQLNKPVVHGMEVEMRGNSVLFLFVRRVLYRRKVEYLVSFGYDNYAAGVLPRGALNAFAARNEPFRLRTGKESIVLFAIALNVAVNGFILQAGYRAGAEGMALAVHNLSIRMGMGLIIAGEVKVNIRRFVSLKAKEYLKRYSIAKLFQLCAANRAVLIRHIHAAGIFIKVNVKFAVPAIWANIVRLQRIHFRYSRHCGNEG